jgi:hypothetical protein
MCGMARRVIALCIEQIFASHIALPGTDCACCTPPALHRTGIVVKLLEEAGQQASDLVQAANRYGQTTLHIVSRHLCLRLACTCPQKGMM